ncbi:MAG: methyltransferase domain-containing protein [Ignavibacteriales bacterium]|nr:methyltransferase domain-containing protein [Ignavibacteriales bacterium]
MEQKRDYLLGANEEELERLRFQHWVWKKVTDNFFDRIGVKEGWKCLDVGSGPGFTTMDLRKRVGAAGEVTALEPSNYYLEWLQQETSGRGWTNVKFLRGKAEDADLPLRYYDFIYFRWVIAFVPDPEKFLKHLIAAVRPGGIIAVQDYWYEGLSLYPRGTSFDRLPDIIRAYYRTAGGDPFVTGKIPSLMRKHGIHVVDFAPHQLAGGPQSDVWEWVHRFLTGHLPLMAEKGVVSKLEVKKILAEWNDQRKNPEAIYFSPIVVDIAGTLEAPSNNVKLK